MIPDTSWEPTAADVAWQKGLIRVLKQKATWAVPGAQSVFKIDNDKKLFVLTVGDPDDETNRRIAKVFKILGFSEGDGPEDTLPTDRFPPSAN